MSKDEVTTGGSLVIRSRRHIVQGLAVTPLVMVAGPVLAENRAGKAAADDPPLRFEMRHSATIGGKAVPYRVISQDIELRNATSAIGRIFCFSYLRDDVRDCDSRPVIFIFNGGPGASSVWLHLGTMGPRTVRLDQDVNPTVTPPFAIVDNHRCLLDVADLVFVDPVGTGFSRISGDGASTDFYGVDEDAAAMAQLIDAWLSLHDRWSSPKFIVGESYGTVRASVMQRMLMGGPRYGGALRAISINGMVLVGAVLHRNDGHQNNYTAQSLLPSMAATAWYHNKVDRAGRTVDAFNAESIDFAQGPYAEALRKGSLLAPPDRAAMARRLSSHIGISADEILRSNLRVSAESFATTLLAKEGLDVGIYDSRYTLPHETMDVALDPVGDDPAMARYTPGFAAAWHTYLRRELGVRIERPYGTIVWSGLSDKWSYVRRNAEPEQTYAVDLSIAMRRNPSMRVMIASGYYDLATPLLATETDLAQAEAPLDRVKFARYPSGHMAYFGGTGDTFLDDVRRFVVSG